MKKLHQCDHPKEPERQLVTAISVIDTLRKKLLKHLGRGFDLTRKKISRGRGRWQARSRSFRELRSYERLGGKSAPWLPPVNWIRLLDDRSSALCTGMDFHVRFVAMRREHHRHEHSNANCEQCSFHPQSRLNHAAPCAVKRAGIVDGIGRYFGLNPRLGSPSMSRLSFPIF